MLVIENARVLRETGLEAASVVVDHDTIVSVGLSAPEGKGLKRIDAGGAWLGPGLVDLHVHFRDPGQTWKEDLDSGGRAAAVGGYTAVVTMPNTDRPVDTAARAVEAMARAAEIGHTRIVVAGALTRARAGAEMADIEAMYRVGIRLFTDDGDSVPEAGLMRRIMRLVASLPGAVVAEHPEDRSLSAGGHLNEGEMSALHGVIGLPGVAEEVIVARDLALAEDTGAPIHIQHVSTAGSVEMVRQAKERGVSVTAEVTPHHLAMDDSALEQLDPILKMYPPLRGAGDRKAVGEALRLGVIDAVATDHAPHAGFEKAVPFEEAPRGVIGLETAAAVANRAVDGDPGLFFDRLSTAPARIAGLARQGNAVEPGAPANLVVFDPNLEWRVKGFESKSGNSPFLGREMTGKVLVTINEGRVTYEGRS